MVAGYRAALADHLGEPEWQDLTQRLVAGSPLFAELWERYDVAEPSTRIKVLEHPKAGLLRVEPAILWLSQLGHLRANVYTAADEEHGGQAPCPRHCQQLRGGQPTGIPGLVSPRPPVTVLLRSMVTLQLDAL